MDTHFFVSWIQIQDPLIFHAAPGDVWLGKLHLGIKKNEHVDVGLV